MGIWYSSTGYVSIFSPLINYGLGHIKGSLSPWRYMYIVAGCLTIIWSFVILVLMPPDPIRAKRFTDRERYIAVARMKINNSGVRNTHFKRAQLFELLTDVKFWMVFAMAFLILVANGPVSTFTPIIIHDLGFSGLTSLLLIMPAGFIIGTIEWSVPYLCYKKPGLRAIMVAVTVSFTLLASLLLWQLPQTSTGPKLFAVYILASYGGGYAVLMSMQIANTAGYTKRSLGSSGMFVGYCLVGTRSAHWSEPVINRTRATFSVHSCSSSPKHLFTAQAGSPPSPRLLQLSSSRSSTAFIALGRIRSGTRWAQKHSTMHMRMT